MDLINELARYPGPFGIVARPHSGTRLLAETLFRNDVYLGKTISYDFFDSHDWYRFFATPLLSSEIFQLHTQAFQSHQFAQLVESCLKKTLMHYLGNRTYNPRHAVISPIPELSSGGWGWKMSEMILLMPTFKRYFPKAKFIHIIRDGRDVILSDDGYFQLTRKNVNRFNKKQQRFLTCVTFGDANINKWQGIRLNKTREIRKNRFLLQMKSWMTCVSFGRSYGRTIENDYLEVKYEDLCMNPEKEASRVFDFLEIEMTDQTKAFLATKTRRTAIGKWHNWQFTREEVQDFNNAIELGKPMLSELGYIN